MEAASKFPLAENMVHRMKSNKLFHPFARAGYMVGQKIGQQLRNSDPERPFVMSISGNQVTQSVSYRKFVLCSS